MDQDCHDEDGVTSGSSGYQSASGQSRSKGDGDSQSEADENYENRCLNLPCSSSRLSSANSGNGRDGSFVQVQAAQVLRSKPVRLADLEAYITQMDAADGFKTEFEGLGPPTTQLRHWTYASRPENLPKHRYPPPDDSLLAYDDTRVVLTKVPGDQFSDFINANWIDDHKYQRSYIATQCPMESTIDDFYRMIWQYNVHEVVMLASQHDMDKNKCSKYFPDSQSSRTEYGGVTIDLQRKHEYPDVTVRIYSLKKNGVSRVWVHHHFTSWPDMGVPDDPQQLLNLILKYRSSDSYTKAWPVVVHCVAGVGRTGTFLLTDAMLDMAKERRGMDFLAHLYHIRNQRVSLVEKPEQYRLAHRVVLEAYKQGLLEADVSIRAGVITGSESDKTLLIASANASHNAIDTDGIDDGLGVGAKPVKLRAPKGSGAGRAGKMTTILIDPEMEDHEIVIRISRDAQTRSSVTCGA